MEKGGGAAGSETRAALSSHTPLLSSSSLPRLQDSWHHPTDVMAGGALGLGLAYLFYRQTFYCFTGVRAGEAYAGGGGGASEAGEGVEGGALAGSGGSELGCV